MTIIDAEGVLARQARQEIVCNVSGAGKLLGLENASNNAAEDFRDNKASANRGRLLAYVQATADDGDITVSFTSAGLESVALKLDIVAP